MTKSLGVIWILPLIVLRAGIVLPPKLGLGGEKATSAAPAAPPPPSPTPQTAERGQRGNGSQMVGAAGGSVVQDDPCAEPILCVFNDH
jgi:hypothetical protein